MGTWAEGGIDGEVLGWEKCRDSGELKGSPASSVRLLLPCGPKERHGSLLGKGEPIKDEKKYIQ